MTVDTVTQQENKERIQPVVTSETAKKLRVAAAKSGRSQGEVIDDLAETLPAVD